MRRENGKVRLGEKVTRRGNVIVVHGSGRFREISNQKLQRAKFGRCLFLAPKIAGKADSSSKVRETAHAFFAAHPLVR